MCIPWRKNRDKQKDVAQGLQPTKSDTIKVQCDQAESSQRGRESGQQDGEALQSKQPKLLRLEMLGTENANGNGRPWAVVSDHCVITVKAITDPPNTPVTWKGGQSPSSNQVEISRTQIKDNYQVTASLEGSSDQSVAVDVFDLVSINRPNPEIFLDNSGRWKTYECGTKASVSATTDPNQDSVLQCLTWRDATTGYKGKDAQFDRAWPPVKTTSVVEIRKATVNLGTICPKSLSQDIRVCRWPKLELVEVGFGVGPVANDGVAEIGKLFDKCWKPGRPQPATNLKTADCQSILCWHGGGKLKLQARFKVIQAPTDTEKVKIEGKASVGGVDLVWSQDVDVNPGDAYVNFPAMEADKPLKAGVAAGSMLKIKWTQSAPPVLYANGTSDPPSDIGESENLLYVVLKPPSVPGNEMYWTLLHLSCQGADGKTTENDFVPAAFAPLKSSTGDGKGIQRKGDGVRLSYYKQGVKTPANSNVYTTLGILGSPEGTGRCGGWMQVLIHMFKMHGVTSATDFACVRWAPGGVDDMGLRFLVKNCSFPPAAKPAAAPYRNLGHELIKPDGVAGQGKTNPQFDFGDHVTVKHNGQIYDPSYGIGPIVSTLDYETQAIAGFGDGTGGTYDRTLADGTPQFVSEKVGPDCLYTETSKAGDTLESLAAKWQMTNLKITELNPGLSAYKIDDMLPAGTSVIVVLPRTGAVLKWT